MLVFVRVRIRRKMRNGCSPSASVGRFVVVANERMIVQDGAHVTPEGAGSLAVYNSDLRQSLLVAGAQIFGDQVPHVGRIKDVKIELTVNRIFLHWESGDT